MAKAEEGRETAVVASVEAVAELVRGDRGHVFHGLGVVLVVSVVWVWDAGATGCDFIFIKFFEFVEVAVGVFPDAECSSQEAFGVEVGEVEGFEESLVVEVGDGDVFKRNVVAEGNAEEYVHLERFIRVGGSLCTPSQAGEARFRVWAWPHWSIIPICRRLVANLT